MQPPPEPPTAFLLLAKLRPAHWPWSWKRLAFSRWAPPRSPGLRFMKTLGSGRDGGFGLLPSASHQGVFCLFSNDAAARAFVAESSLVDRYREASSECLLLTLRPSSSRGSWDGVALAAGPEIAADAPVAALTRAAIRPLAAPAFWRHAPAAQAGLAQADGCELAIGLGEAPLLRQATFSLWRNAAAMDAYARTGAHQEAIRAAWQRRFFSESMFVRFAPVAIEGRWGGRFHG
ncbi:MAG: spheroidene monooxygenase [Burkholderiaceae bacterium]|nr:spheroidene monooxygenase [Burkholderiaceae bacterium]